MNILEYYINKQSDENWVEEFQSTAQEKHGKFFKCLSVNFRSLKSYYVQLNAFKNKDGLKRSKWNDYQNNGQEKDKHRIQALKNAKLIINVDDKFFITEKGRTALKIANDKTLSDKEQWLFIYMLLVDYDSDGEELDIIKSVLDFSASLEALGIYATDLIAYLKDAINLTKKIDLFSKDIFWLITFYKDKEFIRLFLQSTENEKNQLFEWVIGCSKNKKSVDCIAHKFVSGGCYTGGMFNEDVNIILCTLILLTLQDENYKNFISLATKLYQTVNLDKLKEIICQNEEVFNESYNNSFGEINRILKVED